MTPFSRAKIEKSWQSKAALPFRSVEHEANDPFTPPSHPAPAGHVWVYVYGNWVPEPESWHEDE